MLCISMVYPMLRDIQRLQWAAQWDGARRATSVRNLEPIAHTQRQDSASPTCNDSRQNRSAFRVSRDRRWLMGVAPHVTQRRISKKRRTEESNVLSETTAYATACVCLVLRLRCAADVTEIRRRRQMARAPNLKPTRNSA